MVVLSKETGGIGVIVWARDCFVFQEVCNSTSVNLTPQSTLVLLHFIHLFGYTHTRDLILIVKTRPLNMASLHLLCHRVLLNLSQRQFSCLERRYLCRLRAFLFSTLFPSLSHPQPPFEANWTSRSAVVILSPHPIFFVDLLFITSRPDDYCSSS